MNQNSTKNTIVVFILVLITVTFAWNDRSAYNPTKFYNRNGEIEKMMKVYIDSFTANIASGYTIDISPANFTFVGGAYVLPERNTSTASQSPQASVKSISTSSLVVNLTQGSESLVTILGLSVLQGPATVFASTPVKIYVCVIGY